MKKIMAEKVFSLFLMALAASAYWQTLALPKSRTGLITGPAFFPQWLALLLFFCSAMPLIKAFVRPQPEAETEVVASFGVLGKLVLFFLLVSGALLTIPYIGWFPAQFILVLALELTFEKRSWARAGVISAVAVLVIYLIFEIGLQIRLPRGILE